MRHLQFDDVLQLGHNENAIQIRHVVKIRSWGGVSEWPKETVLKTVVAQATVGSNPTPSVYPERSRGAYQIKSKCLNAKNLLFVIWVSGFV